MKKNLIIDLTALLDVILILLFIMITSTNDSVKNSKEEIERLSYKTENLEMINSQLEDQLKDYQSLNNISGKEAAQYKAFQEQLHKIDIICVNEEEGCKITISNETKILDTISIKKGDTRAIKTNEIATILAAELSLNEQEPVIITFRYNNNKIHLFEYNIVKNAFNHPILTDTNIFITEYMDSTIN